MRHAHGLAGLLVTLAALPASAQPTPTTPTRGWRAAVAAALAFGHAEGK